MRAASRSFKLKICLVGDEGVGKTSLMRRTAHGLFDEEYRRTVGTGVGKKRLLLTPAEGGRPRIVTLIVWDIMGSHSFRELLAHAYFDGADGVLAVCDVARPKTLGNLGEWIDLARKSAGPVPVLVAANKADLDTRERVTRENLVSLVGDGWYLFTSAKSGANVDDAFAGVARAALQREGCDHLVEGDGEFMEDIVDILMG